MTEPFYTKRRMAAAKEALRVNPDLKHGGPADLEIQTFLIDLAENVAFQHGDDRDAAFHYLIRNMGVVARKYSKQAYRPHGYKNPFKKASTASPLTPTWTFPIVNRPPISTPGQFEADLRAYSALKMFGYTVGVTNGWPEAKRQRFLSDFMELELPTEVIQAFDDEYGAPMTAKRLRKMANVIASNASNFLRNDPVRFRVAISEWEDDLQFLKTKYYDQQGLQFQPWPSPQ